MDRKPNLSLPKLLELTESDVYSAMEQFGEYLDITPGDFRELYAYACRQARQRLLHAVQAKDIMTAPPLLLKTGMTILEAIGFLDKNNISGAPVADENGRLVGIVSEKDLARALCNAGHFSPVGLMQALLDHLADRQMLQEPIESVMTHSVIAIAQDTPIARMLELMSSKSINRLPVLKNEIIIGIVTRTDMLKAFGFIQ